MTPTAPHPTHKLTWWQAVLFRYRWMSLRNKIALWAVVVIALITAICFQWVKPAYRGMKMFYFIHLAEDLVDKKDYGAASLAYRKALIAGPDRPEAWKSLAKFLEQVDSPEIIGVWERLAKMEPTVREYRYKQLSAALRFGRGYEAEQVLDQMPEAWKDDPDYLRSLANIAIQKNQLEIAEKALNRLLKNNPNDEEARYDLAVANTKSPDTQARLDAKTQLSEIGDGKSKLAAVALRQLIATAVQEGDTTEADRLATKLIALPDATVKDRLTHLQFELVTQSLTSAVSLKKLRAYMEEHPDDFEQVVDWFLTNKVDPEGTAAWIKSLSQDYRNQIQVQSGLLQYYLSVADFKEVFHILRSRSASLNLPIHVLNLAEKAINELDTDPTAADRAWLSAVYASDGNPQALYYLSLLSSAKGWTSATGRALSALADNAPNQAGVWNLLARHESSAGNLPGYYKALCGLMRINPYDIHVASDWVIASVLLRKGETSEVLDVAKRTYNATEPADPWAGTAYAMALLRDKRPQQSYEIMMRMSDANRMLPQRAVYVGTILAASGHKEESLTFFDRAESFADNNFPEELALLRIWRGVAMGEATPAEEMDQILSMRKNLDAETAEIRADLQKQMQLRSNPAEVKQIFNQLKLENESRKGIDPEVQQMMREITKANENRAAAKPAPAVVPQP